jgi:exosortase/archaeosortase family protein
MAELLEERSPPRWLRVGLFLLFYALLECTYLALRSSPMDEGFIHWLTVRPAAALVQWFRPLDGVQAEGPALAWMGGRLALRAGCDGFEVMTLFIAAMLVADVPWRRGVPGLLAGCLLIWLLNQLRILALYGSFRFQRDWFDRIHTLWGPVLLTGCVVAVYALIVHLPMGKRAGSVVARTASE